MRSLGFFVIVGGIVFFCVSLPASATIAYQAIPDGLAYVSTGAIYDSTPTPDYGSGEYWGTAEVRCWYWQDDDPGSSSYNYWFYTYQIINNEHTSGGTGNNGDDAPPEGHHFGWYFNPTLGADGAEFGSDYLGIYLFSVTGFDTLAGNGYGPADLEITGGAGSSGGGGPWDDFRDDGVSGFTGLDWERKAGDNLIDPTTWEWVGGGTKQWVFQEGDYSTDDSGSGQYFQIATKWAPDLDNLVQAEIVVHGAISGTAVQLHAVGSIPGPVMVPEPATCMILLFGSLGLVLKKR